MKTVPKIIVIAILAAAGMVLLVLNVNLLLDNSKYNRNTDKIFEEIENLNRQSKETDKKLDIIGNSSNQVRTVLSLPEIEFSSDKEVTVSEDIEEDSSDLPFYNALEYLNDFYSRQELVKINLGILQSGSVSGFAEKNGLEIKKTGTVSYSFINSGESYFSTFIVEEDIPLLNVKSGAGNSADLVLSEVSGNPGLLTDFMQSELHDTIDYISRLNDLKNEFKNVKEDQRITGILHRNNLIMEKLPVDNSGSGFSIFNEDRSYVLTVRFDLKSEKYWIGNTEADNYSDFTEKLLERLDTDDIRTRETVNVDEARNTVRQLINDEAFTAFTADFNLNLKDNNREDNDYYYFDLIDNEGEIKGSFAVQKIIGDIYLMDSEDVMITSLKYLETLNSDSSIPTMEIPDNLPLITDRYEDNDSTTIVLIGSHENNADTIILIHASSITGKMTLISIPRDLYYMDRKINDYYRTYGGEKFIEILSDITGLSINGFAAVDMYAFVDAVNVLGGIDVYLEADLIDPTYKVRDNGKWSTLYYKKGYQHLNGLEALRIARSRHTSSDFGRTARQQLIIQGIKDKINDIDIGDMGKLLELFGVLENYLNTNFSAMEMLSLFLKYKDTDVEKKQGLSTFNVLYNTYTNIYKLEDKSLQYEDGFQRGLWILLPRNDDWNLIKWYIRKLLEGEEV